MDLTFLFVLEIQIKKKDNNKNPLKKYLPIVFITLYIFKFMVTKQPLYLSSRTNS